MRILAINPGSTSTKIGVFEDRKILYHKTITHSAEEIASYPSILSQLDFRTQLVLDELSQQGYELNFDAVIGRGGLLKPIPGGVYHVTDKMIDDIYHTEHTHACNLGCIIAREIASRIPGGCDNCFIADPVVVDELNDYARVCGSPLMQRMSIWHPLNQRAIARRFARENGKRYEDLNLVVAHLGGGVSVAAHEHGKAVDVNNALDGEGPFAPERAGTLPASSLVKLCFSGKYDENQVMKMLKGNAGLAALLGTNDMREVERRLCEDHDEKAKLFVDAMIYHIAKAICAQGAVLCGKVDAIVLTGGIAYWKYFVDELIKRVSWMAPVHIYPGEDELEALAGNAYAALSGQIEVKEYV